MTMTSAPLRRLAGALALLLTLPAVHAGELPPFSASDAGLLFTAKGSNTVGEELFPSLAQDYLRAKGLVNVQRLALPTANEARVLGYLPERPNREPLYIDIAAHGSSTSFEGLEDGSADLGMSSRPIKDQEVAALAFLGDMKSFAAEQVLAIDGLAIIVHPDNPVRALTLDQVARIFSGQLRNWRELGGDDSAIGLYARDHKSGTWDTFSHLVLGQRYQLHPSAQRFESNTELSAQVSGDRRAIGFVGLAAVNQSKALAIHDQGTQPLAPSQASVATEDYALSRRLFLYVSPNQAQPLVREFVAFAQGQAGQQRAQAVGYIAQNPIEVAADLDQVTDADYLALVRDAGRLSVNIRFQPGSAELDNKAKQDILRLSHLMRQPQYRDRQLLLVGFGDAKQTDSRAKVLSRLRATAVKVALYNQGVSSAPVAGFGAILPVASQNPLRNQRVEIWLQ